MPYNDYLMETPLRELDPEIAEIMVCDILNTPLHDHH